MKKLPAYLSIAFLGVTFTSFANTDTPDCKENCESLVLEDIAYIEPTEEVALDFETATYLPEGFDAYQGMHANLTDIEFLEEDQDIELGFNTAAYLPTDFNAYSGMEIDLSDIEYIEQEEEVELQFDTASYLPKNFSASAR